MNPSADGTLNVKVMDEVRVCQAGVDSAVAGPAHEAMEALVGSGQPQ